MAEEDKNKFKREFVKNLYDTRQKIIDLFNSYSKIRSEALYKSKKKKKKKIKEKDLRY